MTVRLAAVSLVLFAFSVPGRGQDEPRPGAGRRGRWGRSRSEPCHAPAPPRRPRVPVAFRPGGRPDPGRGAPAHSGTAPADAGPAEGQPVPGAAADVEPVDDPDPDA